MNPTDTVKTLRRWEVTVANLLKKLIKRKAGDLEAGETYLGATYAQPAGSFGAVAGGLVGGLAGGLAAGRAADERKAALAGTDGFGIATQMPQEHVVLALTNRRFMVFGFSHMGERPKDLLVHIPASDVTSMDLSKRTAHKSLVITFADGSRSDFDMVTGSKPASLIEAFEALLA